jgi:hypothetical protein
LINWSCSGDANFAASTSSYLTQIVGTNAPPFTLINASNSSLSVTAGQSVGVGLAVESVPNFKGTVTFSCSGLPRAATCGFGPAQITPTSYISYTTLTMTTTGSASSIPTFHGTPPFSNPFVLAGIFSLSALPLWLVAQQRTRRRPLLSGSVLVGAFLLVLCFAVGCGGGTPAPTLTPRGTYQITVTATSGSAMQSVTVSLTVS